eukprot:682331_1
MSAANNATFLQWTVSGTLLIHKDYEQAVGVYNNSIFLIGYKMHQFLITNYFPNRIPINTVYDDACLASSDGYLYVLGGRGSGIDVQVLDISTKQWLDNVPSMLNSRKWFACIVDPNSNFLYAVGSHSSSLKSIERIQTHNITFNAWNVSDNLSAAVGFPRCVYLYDKIWVIGGYYGTYGSPIWNTDVHLIHSNGTVSLYSNVSYGQYGAPVIFTSDTIYVFGGRSSPGTSSAVVRDTFMYYSFPSDYAMQSTFPPTNITNISATNTSAKPITSTMEILNNATMNTAVISSSVFDDSDISGDESGLILALAITGWVLFIFMLIFGLIYYWRRRKRADSEPNADAPVQHRDDRVAEDVVEGTNHI